MGDSGNVTYFGDVADRFDALVAYDEKLLDNWVEESGYSLGSMVVASTAMAFKTFAKGFVDVGRVGNWILVEGGWKGAGKDALRALNIVGGAGAVISRGARLLRVVQVGNTCAPVSQVNALRLSGQRFLITVEELAKKAGLNLQQIALSGRGATTYTDMVSAMQKMGVAVKTLAQGTPMGLQSVVNLIRMNAGGVVTFSIRTAAGAQPHRLYAVWSRLGGLVIRDPNYLLRTYRSVAQVEKVWGAGAVVSGSPVLFVPNSVLMTAAGAAEVAGGASGLASIAVQVLPVVQVPAGDPETAVQALEVRDRMAAAKDGGGGRKPGGKGAPAGTGGGPVPGKSHTVVAGDWLSKIAGRYYGNIHKWPVIFAANRKVIGRNPDLIRPGQVLFVPDLPHARILAAREVPDVPHGFAVA
jgi:LysM repeat protein